MIETVGEVDYNGRLGGGGILHNSPNERQTIFNTQNLLKKKKVG